MKRFEVGKAHPSFQSFRDWIAKQIPASAETLKHLSSIAVERTILGDTCKLIFASQIAADAFESNHLASVERAVLSGMKIECGVEWWAVEAKC